MKHWEKHPEYVEGCFGCKISSVKLSGTAAMKMEREGRGPGKPGQSTREYVKEMYESRRARGLPDPEPENRKAAAMAPKQGIFR